MRLLFAFCALFALTVNAADKSSGAKLPVRISTTTPQGREIVVEALTDNIVRVTNRTIGEKVPASKTLVAPKVAVEASKSTTEGHRVLTTTTGVQATLSNSTGEVLITAGPGRGVYDDGVRNIDGSGRKTMRLMPLDNSKTFFGAGERGHSLNLYGDTLVMYNRQNYGYTDGDPRISQMNITMPLLISPNGYAIVVDDYAEAEMIAGNPIEYSTIAPDAVSYYFINSPGGMSELTAQLSDLTGRQDLPPFWALGYITSKYGYKTQAETDSVVNTLKAAGYPLDGIVLDLYWYGKEQDMGRLAWDAEQWPNSTAMLRGLKDKGVNLVAISQPYVLRNGRGLDNYNSLSKQGMLGRDSIGGTKDVTIWVGEGGMLDVSNPDTRAWLRERYKQLTDSGITGWWGDLGEPEVHPDGMMHANGLTNRQYHNLYGNDWSRIIYDLFAEEYPDTRLMTLMRGGTVGLQRYSVFPWSTDVSRSWGGLQPQVKIMLNSGLSGMGYMSHDVGGFAIDPEHPYDPELYVRWLQLGIFSPILRTHAQDFAEPYLYPDHQDIILPLVKERYRWLPYNYTLAYENATKGLPLVRPVGMYTDHPEAYADVEDEYLWGRDVLVAPVTEPGASSRQVRLPHGLWINLNNLNQVVRGDTTITVDAPLSVLPMFVRAGALIPTADYDMENTLAYSPNQITINYYPVEPLAAAKCRKCSEQELKTTFTLFEDDRTSTHTIERDDYALIKFSADNSKKEIRLTANIEGAYDGMPQTRELTFVIHNVSRPRSVSATQIVGATKSDSSSVKENKSRKIKLTQQYNASMRTLTVVLPAFAQNATIAIKR